MLKKIWLCFLLFILFFGSGQAIPLEIFLDDTYNSNRVSPSVSTLQIGTFKYTNRKKELNAILLNHLIAIKSGSLTDSALQDLFFQHIRNLLNAELSDEAVIFLDSIEGKIQFKNHIPHWKLCFWRGVVYTLTGDLIDAEKLYNIAAKELAATRYDSINLGLVYYYHALLYQRQGKRNQALPFYLKSIELLSAQSRESIDAYRRISTTYTLRNDFKKGLDCINLALAQVGEKDKLSFPYEIPKVGKIDNLDIFANILQSRAFIFREMAKGTNDSVFFLQLSVRDAEASIVAFEKYKRSLVFESDLVYVNSLYRNFYSKTIEAINRLYLATGNDSLLYRALEYAEMDKVSALVYTIQRNKALNNSDIPNEAIDSVELLYRELSNVEALRYNEQANSRINDTSLYDINKKLYQLVTEITQKEKNLENRFPAYQFTKYDVVAPKLESMLKMSHEKAIFEYILSKEKLYTFLLTDGKLYFSSVVFDNDFLVNIAELQLMISDSRSIDFSVEEQTKFVTISNSLYSVLIGPFANRIKGKSLLIVPDEQLSLIPFEVLVTSPVIHDKLNYATLEYLVNTHDISYTYSLSLSQNRDEKKASKMQHEVFSMAPSYSKLAGNKGEQYLAMRDARDNLGYLKGAFDEVKLLNKTIKGIALLGNEATEEEFKLNAGNYSVLHLAMHTLVNNEEPLYSKLIFTPNADKSEDGLLNTYELSELNLGSELVVLSACNTGFGKLNNGEGIVGITRGFFQAGCKSILATLWSVSDKTSFDIVKGFYKELEQGQTKSESLSASKRKYLASAKGMLAHPFFWAGFVTIGNDQPIELSPKTSIVGYVLVGSFILLAFFGTLFFIGKKSIEVDS
ncbi:MAG: CHAT domain-containing tetratricopeptide repeat protein [Salinivirgaceae bacterium]